MSPSLLGGGNGAISGPAGIAWLRVWGQQLQEAFSLEEAPQQAAGFFTAARANRITERVFASAKQFLTRLEIALVLGPSRIHLDNLTFSTKAH